jgi:hypothetical protein
MLRIITAATLLLAAAPAMAQYVATPYGNNGMLLTPNSGQTLGYPTSPPPMQTFVVPNAQLQQQARPNLCASFSNAYGQLHC